MTHLSCWHATESEDSEISFGSSWLRKLASCRNPWVRDIGDYFSLLQIRTQGHSAIESSKNVKGSVLKIYLEKRAARYQQIPSMTDARVARVLRPAAQHGGNRR